MSVAYLFGDTASVSNPTGLDGKFASFSIAITQSIGEAAAFGDSWVTTRGLMKRGSLTQGGFVVSGGGASSGLAAVINAPAAWTGTFTTGYFVTGNVVFSDFAPGVAVEDAARQTVNARFSGAVTETWPS